MESLNHPPPWVDNWLALETSGNWGRVKPAKAKRQTISSNPEWEFWKEGADIINLKGLHGQPAVCEPALEQTAVVSRVHLLSPQSTAELKRDAEDREALALLGLEFLMDGVSDNSEDELQVGQSEASDTETDSESETGSVIKRSRPTAQEAAKYRHLFLKYFDLKELPSIPTTKRSIDELLLALDIGDSAWNFSLFERRQLVRELGSEAKASLDENSWLSFQQLARRHKEARNKLAEASDNVRVSLLERIELVGATTNGAAKLGAVMKGFAPKVLVIEEAGQVLEAHVLAALFPSIQHVIAIGDPLQLRPSVNVYGLSMDSPRGRSLFRFDMSLMERLETGGLPMSQLRVQRRMNPAISSLLRNTLYPNLIDHDLVLSYPHVAGMAKSLFFMHHTHGEKAGGDSGSSKSNPFEAAMACDLALYLLKQGCYSREGDIVILCAYLGQVIEVRERLKGKVTVIIDERDREKLVKTLGDDGEDGSTLALPTGTVAKQVETTKQILLRTVDNFQGEEAAVVILSLVRNGGSDGSTGSSMASTIGFLRSRNRTNVALSRAKHGMYIFGNADQLACSNDMWRTIINELGDSEAIGTGIPIACKRHGDVKFINEPGVLGMMSPDGGCMRPCESKLTNCGHRCTRKCHPDDLEHKHARCVAQCARLHEACGHPCTRLCAENCGKCLVSIEGVTLPCGHSANIFCWQSQNLQAIRCVTPVPKPLPFCEHSAVVECHHDDLSDIQCHARCDMPMACCSKTCVSPCHSCLGLTKTAINQTKGARPRIEPFTEESAPTNTVIERTHHVKHNCGALVPGCGHPCGYFCGSKHTHSTATCIAPCHRACEHGECPSPCHEACSPCAERCTWACEHKKCAMPCGMPCDRLPCDEPCRETLSCGHRCSSLCGEPCSGQVCTVCATSDQLEQVVDLIMQATLRDSLKDDPNRRLITLECGHIFTLETLDGHMDLRSYYTTDNGGTWRGPSTPSGYQPRKACPSCRASISSPRYHRVTKRALLDLQEQVAVVRFNATLHDLSENLAAMNEESTAADIAKLLNGVVKPSAGKFDAKRMVAELGKFTDQMIHCVEAREFHCEKTNIFGIVGVLGHTWRKAAQQHLYLYAKLAKLVNQSNMPHNVAYQSAVSSIYFQELEFARQSIVTRSRDPQKTALLTARRRVGAPPPGGQAVYSVEALALTIEIRLQMFRVALHFVDFLWKGEGVGRFHGKNAHEQERQALAACRKGAMSFQRLATGLLLSCTRDAQVMIGLATRRDLPRLILQGHFLWLTVAADLTQYKSRWLLRVKSGAGGAVGRTNVDAKAKIVNESAEARKQCTSRFFKALGVLSIEQKGNEAFISQADKMHKLAEQVTDDWKKFEDEMLEGRWYEDVTLEEKQAVLRAVLEREYGSAGHLYQCPRGHPYMIGDCGGAMVEARCNECGALIGGGSHRLRNDNRIDEELEDIARSVDRREPANPWVAHW
ncbi:unnamed protein product [Cutaneotrichosporon oleaginosum]